jgi:hypothetical protein
VLSYDMGTPPVTSSVANPDPVRFLPLDPDRGSEMRNSPDPESRMDIPDLFSESLETVFEVKILKTL